LIANSDAPCAGSPAGPETSNACLSRASAGRVNNLASDIDPSEVHAVLTLTDRAAATIRTLTSQPGIPEETGLRMSLQDSDAGTLALSLEGPQPDDAVVEDGGARVFVQRDAAGIVDDRELDAELDEQGRASFMLGSQSG
jgi:Fe-S cluster assembly iron-binding protein IscA